MDIAALFLADVPSFQVDAVDYTDTTLRITARTTALPVACSVCHTLTGHVQSHYIRRLADLPCLARTVSFIGLE